jgi:hypothetical protein
MTTATMEKKIKVLEHQVQKLEKAISVRSFFDSLPYDEEGELSPILKKKLNTLKEEPPTFEYTGPGSLLRELSKKKKR